jgi:hypothetical protein
MNSFQRYTCKAILVGLCLAFTSGAYAQVNSINSIQLNTRFNNAVPGATLTTVSSYPSLVKFTEANVSGSGFANGDGWFFSNNGGSSAYQFQNNDYFNASFDLTVTGDPTSTLRKEGGIIFNSASVGTIQFLVDTDAGEVVQFGGISFYNFHPAVPTYVSGTTINMGMKYFLAGDGNNALQFSAAGVLSPVFEFSPGAGIGNGSTFEGYFQIVQDPAVPTNTGSGAFANISITSVPEPSTLAFLGLGIMPLLLRRRCHI